MSLIRQPSVATLGAGDYYDVAADATGVYFSEQTPCVVRKFPFSGEPSFIVAGTGPTATNGPDGIQATQSGLFKPSALTIDAKNRFLYVSCLDVNSLGVIRKVDLSTGIITTPFAGVGPTFITTDAQGKVYQCGGPDGTYEILDPYMNEIMGEIGAPGPSITPVGVAVDAQGNVYTIDYGTGVVYKYDPASGTYASVFPNRQLSNPQGLAIDPSGRFLYAPTSNQISSMDLQNNGQVTVVAGNGYQGHRDGSAPTAMLNKPRGMAVSPLPGTSVNFLYWADTGTDARALLYLVLFQPFKLLFRIQPEG
jgi:hypothetical protein